ncbi:endonuclease [Noumeavirus]|uniref:endonuclease n=1 Tax=Noumeavirus TaxID=1955558 RepID=UPI000982C699|nr:endonuclease [Noumeavirus]AQM73374.1 endonuclease [Noumeavirus]
MNCKTRRKGTLCGREECKYCFERSFASHRNSKYLAEGQGNPLLMAKSSGKKFSFVCPKCEHSFETRLSSVSNEHFCPFCSCNKLCSFEECETCFEKSFASHKKAEFWSVEKNKQIPREVFATSHKKFWFDCEKCKHSFELRLADASVGSFCPFCSNPPKKLCDSESCKTCFEKSFASHEKAEFWSVEKNKQSPREVFLNSNKKFWFDCEKCSHSFDTNLNNVSSGYFCPFCSHNKLCIRDDCETCFGKSFASHKKAEFWSVEKNKQSPREVFLNSKKKYWFGCEKEHKFLSTPSNVSRGSWCPKCKHKTEAKLLSFLQEHFQAPTYQFKVSWCSNPKTGRLLPFDFCVSKTIIELDGAQHYKQVRNWQTPELTQKNDRYKEECAVKNGYSVLRILQEDVWNDKMDWKSLLLEHIRDYETPIVQNIHFSGTK